MSSVRGGAASSRSVPTSGRKTQTVGIAPTEVIQSMARIDDSGGSRPAMISPFVTHGSCRGPFLPSVRAVADGLEVVVEAVLGVLARADLLEELAVEDLEAERDAVDAHLAQRVVALEVAVRRRLDADQEAQLLLDAHDVGLEDVEVGVAVVVAGVEVDVGDARLVARAARTTSITSSTDFSSASSTPRLRPTEQNLQLTFCGFAVQYSQTLAW